ncbi:tellurite resistance TerB family protein [Vibrio caribbeanicus]|uniref:tellurite resistance TerB family protein n=1 Tax=Vibrio caribbeanicus TaxID=701175 RepID=UPI002284E653|nr:tellurite resistance TerB family protein [Vibrio caribbeanicus]MCY9845778.1 tellurite resistance TerB family protein [Vibrio caribbeanicus]
MDLKNLLNQALNSDLIQQGQQQLKKPSTSNSIKSLGTGALGGGLVGMLMGSKKSRKLGKKVGKNALKIGGAAALGVLAYKVYNNYQSSEKSEQPQFNENDPIHNELILKAMIAAAKADGHVDSEEMNKILSTLEQAGAEAQLQSLIHSELSKPLDPCEIASLAQTPQQASEIYMASLIIVDEENFMEKAYLGELAKQLKLDNEIVYQLEQQIR